MKVRENGPRALEGRGRFYRSLQEITGVKRLLTAGSLADDFPVRNIWRQQ